MKAKTPSVTTPAPAPVAQTDDMTQKKMNNGSPIESVRKQVMIVLSWLVL